MTDLPDALVVAAALQLVLDAHQRYLNGEPGGVRLSLRGANMTDADMTGADMTDAWMIAANMTGACMRGARMITADMTNVNMTGADMTEADMTGARMKGACMRGARMAGADFRGTLLHQQAAELAALQAEPPTHDLSQP